MQKQRPQEKKKTTISTKRGQSQQKDKRAQSSQKNERQLSKITEAFNFNRASNVLRNWLKKHGKEDRIDFKDEEILELRKYFSSLDGDGSGSIGLDELEDPLIALGLAQTRDEVEKLIADVDDDESGQIEFKEFLSIMSSVHKGGADVGTEKSPIYDFFKKMSTGQLGEEMDQNIPFKLNVSQFRRRKILDAIMEDDKDKRDKGLKILQAFKRQLVFYKQQEKVAKGEDPNDISLDLIPNKENGVNPRNGFPKMQRIIQPDKRVVKPKAVMNDK